MKTRLAIAAACGVALAISASAQTLVRSVPGPAANAQFGKACIVVPDQNGDGYKDLIVGAPGFNQDRGAIYCVSGAYLAFGTGSPTLWSLAPTANQGDHFGWAIADVGDVTGDNVRDFLVGQPGYDSTTANDVGAVRLISGATHAVVSLIQGPEQACMFGSAVAGCGDVTGDGLSEAAVGAPGPNSVSSYMFMLWGSSLTATTLATSAELWHFTLHGSEELGAAIAGGFDFDGINGPDVVFAAPAHAAYPGGSVYLSNVASPFGSGAVAYHPQAFAGERLGASLDAAQDYDGDGVIDIVVGAPNSPTSAGTPGGRVVVLSSAKLRHQTPPYEIYSFTLAGNANYHLGTAVCACADLNGDGIGEILGGEPDYFFNGGVNLYSGATGTRIAFIPGGSFDHLGEGLAGTVNDLDGDGFKEFVVAGARSNAGGTGSGVVKCYRLFPIAPATYCTGKLNSLGCMPAIASSGTPSANSIAPFNVTAINFVNQKNGLLFYSHAPIAVAFQGGFKCAANPIVRTPPMNSGGATSGSSCTGAYSFDFNAWIVNGWDSTLAPGSEIYAQYWSRDPASASHTGLSDALRFVINP